MRTAVLESLLSFCIGVAWVGALFFAVVGFSYAYPMGVFFALVIGVISLLIGLSGVIFFEGVNLLLELLKEQQKQTRLLEEMNSRSRDTLPHN